MSVTLRHLGNYRKRKDPEHPLANVRGMVPIHRAVLYDKIGPGSHPCQWCNHTVTWTTDGPRVPGALIVDHINADKFDNRLENLAPSCLSCNSRRGGLSKHRRLRSYNVRPGRESRPREDPANGIVDAAEIARRLSVRLGTVHQWRLRGIGFPEPFLRLDIGPIWIWSAVRAWAVSTGREIGEEPPLGRSEVV